MVSLKLHVYDTGPVARLDPKTNEVTLAGAVSWSKKGRVSNFPLIFFIGNFGKFRKFLDINR